MIEHKLDDATLYKGILEGDERTFHYLKKLMMPKIRSHVMNNSGAYADADEVFQDASIACYMNLINGKYQDSGKFEAYFMIISVNTWKNRLSKRKRLGEVELKTFDKADDNWNEQLEYMETNESKIELVLSYLESMGSPCSEILKLYYFEKVKLDVIAEKYKWTYPYVKKQNYKCKRKLQTLVKGDDSFNRLFQ